MVDASYAPFSSLDLDAEANLKAGEKLSQALLTSLESSVQLYRFPKSSLDIYLTVLENDGSVLPSSIVCASLALASAGVEMYDLVASITLAKCPVGWIVNPTAQQEKSAVANVTISIMPSRQLITGFDASGKIDSDEIATALCAGVEQCSSLCEGMRCWLIDSL